MTRTVRLGFLLLALLIWPRGFAEPAPQAQTATPPKKHDLVSLGDFERIVATDPAAGKEMLRKLADGLMSKDPSERTKSAKFATAASRACFEWLGTKGPPWSEADMNLLLAFQLLDAPRFVRDADYRERVLEILPATIPAERFPALRDRDLDELNQIINFDFDSAERIAYAWHAVPRMSAGRQRPFDQLRLSYPDDSVNPIAASFFSLPSVIVGADEAKRFLSAVAQAAPGRTIVVLTDEPNLDALAPLAPKLGLTLIDAHERQFTPWPRDPFTIATTSKGQTVFLVRPNVQQNRDDDFFMARAFIQGLAPRLDQKWGKVIWTRAPVPFHNGKILRTPRNVWIDLNTLEVRNLQILGLDRVPASSFASLEGIARYISTSRKAAGELEALYGKPVRFVHPLPTSGSLEERKRLMWEIACGAKYDLDSLVSILPSDGDSRTAMVSDVDLGAKLIAETPASDWTPFLRAFKIASKPETAAADLGRAQTSDTARDLEIYLNLVAGHLRAEGLKVIRVPLMVIPASLVNDSTITNPFLITWANVVLQGKGERRTAEGFSSLLARGDAIVTAKFREAGYTLNLFPPLVRSVMLNGGYRCASNHLRRAARH